MYILKLFISIASYFVQISLLGSAVQIITHILCLSFLHITRLQSMVMSHIYLGKNECDEPAMHVI